MSSEPFEHVDSFPIPNAGLPQSHPILGVDHNPYAAPQQLTATVAPPPPVVIKSTGPGILISFCWLIALFAAQVAFGIAGFIVVAAVSAASGSEIDLNQPDAAKELYESKWGGLTLLASSQFSTMLVAMLAAFIHARGNLVERLDLRLPKPHHWALGMLAVVPMSILATEAAVVVGQLDGFSLKYLQESLDGVNAIPFAGVLVFGCLFPGLFEELLFRSVMGRGMTGRWGLWIGVGFASLFFGMAHIIPAHVASAALMGVFLHMAFIYSRSFWVPVSMHIVNNAMAFTLGRYEDLMPIPGYTSDMGGDKVSHISPQLLGAGLFATLALMVCWRHYRTQIQDEAAAASNAETPHSGLGWLTIIGLLLTQAILFVALTSSIEKT